MEEKPPFLKTWRNVYALIVGVLIALMAVFYFFTNHFK